MITCSGVPKSSSSPERSLMMMPGWALRAIALISAEPQSPALMSSASGGLSWGQNPVVPQDVDLPVARHQLPDLLADLFAEGLPRGGIAPGARPVGRVGPVEEGIVQPHHEARAAGRLDVFSNQVPARGRARGRCTRWSHYPKGKNPRGAGSSGRNTWRPRGAPSPPRLRARRNPRGGSAP